MEKEQTQDSLGYLYLAVSFVVFPVWFDLVFKTLKGVISIQLNVLLSLLVTLIFIMLITFLFGKFIKSFSQIQERGYIEKLCIPTDVFNDFMSGKYVECKFSEPPGEATFSDLSGIYKIDELRRKPSQVRGYHAMIQLKNPPDKK